MRTGCQVKFEFYVNNDLLFSIIMSHAIFGTYLFFTFSTCEGRMEGDHIIELLNASLGDHRNESYSMKNIVSGMARTLYAD